MKNFFRTLRQKLIEQNKFTRYVFYAIGEISLIIIGILIALQINNWNEGRKSKILQFDLLEEIKAGLESDVSDIDYNINMQKVYQSCHDTVIKWIKSNESFHDSIGACFPSLYANTFFAVTEGPYSTLKEIGINIIENDSLRLNISNLFEVDFKAYHVRSDLYKERVSDLYYATSKYLNGITRDEPLVIQNVGEFKSDNEIMYFLTTNRFVGNSLLNTRMIPIKAEIENTIKMINEELEKR